MTENELQPEELDLRAYFRPVWRRKWIVLIVVIIATAGTYVVSNRKQKSYVASSELFVTVGNPANDLVDGGVAIPPSATDLANIAGLITTQATAAAVQKILPSAPTLGSVSASVGSSTSSFVIITANGPTARGVAELANAYAKAFLMSRQQGVIAAAQAALATVDASLKKLPRHPALGSAVSSERTTLLQQAATYNSQVLDPTVGAQQVQTATAPGAPVSPKPKRDAIFGGVVGLVLAIIAAFALELLDRRLLGVEAIESIFNRPVLAVLPHVSDPTPLVAEQAPVVPIGLLEPLRGLAVFLRLTHKAHGSRTIAITSTLPQEGKSTITRDLSIIYAEAGSKVLVIDCDLRRPSAARLFGLLPQRGLVHILRDGAPLLETAVRGAPALVSEQAEQSDPAAHDGIGLHLEGYVDVITHGEVMNSPLALLSSPRMDQLLAEAAEIYDVIILDTAPMLVVADAVPLLEKVDGILVTARVGQTTRAAAGRFRQVIDRLGNVNLYGIIANDLKEQDEASYGATGYYGLKNYYSPGEQTIVAGTGRTGVSALEAGTFAESAPSSAAVAAVTQPVPGDPQPEPSGAPVEAPPAKRRLAAPKAAPARKLAAGKPKPPARTIKAKMAPETTNGAQPHPETANGATAPASEPVDDANLDVAEPGVGTHNG